MSKYPFEATAKGLWFLTRLAVKNGYLISLEHSFHPTRKWRFDVAIPELRLAMEFEGATFANGRHTRGVGFENDCRKYAEAAILGWTVLRFTGGMVRTGEALDVIERAIKAKETGRERLPIEVTK